jgi:hypothetical protein
MKLKHNKKRNTAFLFETLVREITKAAIRGEQPKKKAALKIIKEHFVKEGILYKELQLYKSIYESRELDHITAQKILYECRSEYSKLDKKEVFKRQSLLIAEVNRKLSSTIYNNFVPSYRSLASIAALFGETTPVKSRVLLEGKLLTEMMKKKSPKRQIKEVDNVVFRQFVKNFNKEYAELLSEQKKTISLYLADKTQLLSYLNEEIVRLHQELQKGTNVEEIKTDSIMLENTQKVIAVLDDIKKSEIHEAQIIDILKIQKLVSEIRSDDD